MAENVHRCQRISIDVIGISEQDGQKPCQHKKLRDPVSIDLKSASRLWESRFESGRGHQKSSTRQRVKLLSRLGLACRRGCARVHGNAVVTRRMLASPMTPRAGSVVIAATATSTLEAFRSRGRGHARAASNGLWTPILRGTDQALPPLLHAPPPTSSPRPQARPLPRARVARRVSRTARPRRCYGRAWLFGAADSRPCAR